MYLPYLRSIIRRMNSCAIYLSTGLQTVASRAAGRAARVAHVAVVDTFTDAAYARSSVKLVAREGQALVDAAYAVVEEALSIIDLSLEPHPAPHPRCGAVDMVSFMPLSEHRSSATPEGLQECDRLAWDLASRIATADCPILLFGPRAGRSLLDARRATTFFSSTKANACRDVALKLVPDMGPTAISQRRGVCILGAQPYVTNFNVQIEHASLEAARLAAKALRTRMAIQVMALPHEGETIEIGCNLQASTERDSPSLDAVFEFLAENLPKEAAIRSSYVVGLTPSAAHAKALSQLILECKTHDGSND